MDSIEKDTLFLESVLGQPLPEIDEIYFEGSKIWEKTDNRPLITPYFLSKLYTVEEMKMVLCLPGSPLEVAEKLGLDEAYVEEKLKRLFEYGRILPGKSYHKETNDRYAPNLSPVTLRDHIGMAYNKKKLDWNEERELFLLADEWCMKKDYSKEEKEGFPKTNRIIPKWGSIKNLPGVMPCENMKEIIYENYKNGTMAIMRCICRSYKNYKEYGKPHLEDGGGCASGLKENGTETGHCLWMGQRGIYMSGMFGYVPETIEEVDKLFDEIEHATVVYQDKNMPQVGMLCSCCEDCCIVMNGLYKKGIDVFSPSRFRPGVRKEKCIGCKTCEKHCIFHAISYDDDGKCVIDEERCKGCGNCVMNCEAKALKMKIVHDRDWIPNIEDYVK
ncbi:MAG: 4Fe-4S binding protein [Erysipelotrichaceae bacterium]|nr:4Fe-4S binding protein [Erysipelotrichaceae bacterium]